MNGWMMGWASAPYDPLWARRYPKRAAWMSLAGPMANFAIAIVAGLSIRIGRGMGFFQPSEGLLATSGDAVLTLLGIAFFLNILLGTFNLLPLPPLDGFTAIGRRDVPNRWPFGGMADRRLLFRPRLRLRQRRPPGQLRTSQPGTPTGLDTTPKTWINSLLI
jgi:Zn-dependent protease